MKRLLVIDQDPRMLAEVAEVLERSGYSVFTTTHITDASSLHDHGGLDGIIAPLHVATHPTLGVRSRAQAGAPPVPFIALIERGRTRDAADAIRLGSIEIIEKPVDLDDLIRVVTSVVPPPLGPSSDAEPDIQAHAAARWARIVVQVKRAPRDPRTIRDWSRFVFASPGAIRNWCRVAGIPPRKSLIFARLLRVVVLSEGGRHRPENLLDVVDMRTLNGILRLAGFSIDSFPKDVGEFLHRQSLIRERDTLTELHRELNSPHTRGDVDSWFPRPRLVAARLTKPERHPIRSAK